jgi:hypothetical protein
MTHQQQLERIALDPASDSIIKLLQEMRDDLATSLTWGTGPADQSVAELRALGKIEAQLGEVFHGIRSRHAKD